jgi:hypothetical protein
MSTNAIFNRRVLLQVRGEIENVVKKLERLPATGEAIDNEIDRVKRLLQAAVRNPRVPLDNAPICQVHEVAMVKRQGKFGEFWSCPEKTNGVWCNYRPPRV